MSDDAFACRVAEDDGTVVVTLSGPLSLMDCMPLRKVLDKHLMDRGRVVVEADDLRVLWPAAVAVFPTALAATGGWPSARLVIACSDPAVRQTLKTARVPNWVPVVPDVAAAAAALDRRPPSILRTSELIRSPRVAQHARALVDHACADWDVPEHREAAMCVASELATNAYQHGAGAIALRLTVDLCGMRVAVRDEGGGNPAFVEDGYGLRVVDQLCTAWGVIADPPGKWVWTRVRPIGQGTSPL